MAGLIVVVEGEGGTGEGCQVVVGDVSVWGGGGLEEKSNDHLRVDVTTSLLHPLTLPYTPHPLSHPPPPPKLQRVPLLLYNLGAPVTSRLPELAGLPGRHHLSPPPGRQASAPDPGCPTLIIGDRAGVKTRNRSVVLEIMLRLGIGSKKARNERNGGGSEDAAGHTRRLSGRGKQLKRSKHKGKHTLHLESLGRMLEEEQEEEEEEEEEEGGGGGKKEVCGKARWDGMRSVAGDCDLRGTLRQEDTRAWDTGTRGRVVI
ncbi:hypothetical protein O3P69_006724 [Scylla paramamosain]|uniref:Uncharacterized protein n=1 Tax=Scylla paramamosain TaxID=85552 RepID=A0AAW0U462_SCYPA